MTDHYLTTYAQTLGRPKRYRIKPKRDWPRYGFYDAATRTNIKTGYVVTDGVCNVMPGATWFRTVADAFLAIEVHKVTGDTQAFWAAYDAAKAQRAAAAIRAAH